MAFLLNRKKILFLGLYLLLFFATCNNPLFWDTMQFASFHPSWYYYNDFRYIWLPETIDSGHPPFFGLYLAAVWKVLGRNLWATHLAMLPFVILIVQQAARLGDVIFGKSTAWSFICTLVILSETVLLGQIILASPDVVLIAFFLLGVNAVLTDSRKQLAIAAIFLSVISTRGMMCLAALYIFSVCYSRPGRRHNAGLPAYLLAKAIPFCAGGLLAAVYLVWHRIDTGWGGFNRNTASPWAAGFERVDAEGFLRNLIILCWRMVDLGKVLTVAVCMTLLISRVLKRKNFIPPAEGHYLRGLLFLTAALWIISALPLCLFTGLMGHRYLLPFTTALAVCGVILLAGSNIKYKKVIAAAMILTQLSGNFWVYPAGYATGWDATLAQLPYYSLREDFMRYIEAQGISKKDIGSQFPLWSSEYGIDLGTDTTRYRDALKEQTPYVWYSNVCNSLQDSASYYFRNFRLLKYAKKGQVEMALFERR